MNEVKATATALNQEILGGRRAWQEGKIDSEQLAQVMTSLGIRANALLAPLEAQKAAILALGVPTKQQSLELERLTVLTNGYSLAAQRAAAGVDAAQGIITRGSLAAGVQAGTAGLSASLRQATADTTRLMDAERAGLITKEQYILGLADQSAAHRLALTGIEAEAVALRGLGVLDVQQTERLAQLAAAQNGYTAALARTVSAQQAQANAQRAAAGAALGLRGAGGMNNLAMGAMFVSPELGMAAMAATMGPVIATAAAVGVLVKTLGDGIDKAAIFQRGLQQVGAISGESAEQMNHFGGFVQQLSTDIPVSTQRLTELGREAVMVGLHGPEGMRVYTENMAAFAVITRTANGELGHTAEVGQEVVKILRSTGATTSEVTAGFGQMINGLVGLKTESGVAIPQVTALLKFWSSQGHAVGLTINQMTGLSAALIQTGARAQGAGGAMAKFFDTAESAAATGGAKLQAWANVIGLSAEKTKELLKNDPMEFLRRFVTGAEQMDHGGKALSLTLGSVGLNSAQVRRTMAELNNALPLVTGNIKIMNDASQDQGLAMRKAVDATDDYKDKVTLLGQGFDVLKTNMGMSVLPGMTDVLSWAIDLSKALNDAVTYQEKLKKALGTGTAAPGGDTYDLKTWLKNSGLNIGQLNGDQLAQAQKLLSQLQGVENARVQYQNLADHSLLPSSPAMDSFYRKSIGEIGVKLGAIQQQVSGQGTTMGPLTEAQQRLSGTPSRGFNKSKGEAILAAAKELKINPNDLAAAISFESAGTFDTNVRNPTSSATGLIQFMKGVGGTPGKYYGMSRDEFGGLSFEKQMEYVFKFLRDEKKLQPGSSLGTIYDSISGYGYKKGSAGYDANIHDYIDPKTGQKVKGQYSVWDTNHDGVVSRGEGVKSPEFKSHIANYFPGADSTGGAGDGEEVAPKALAAYVKEVNRLQAAIETASKANNQTAWESAKADLAAFTAANKEKVRLAQEWISDHQKAIKVDQGLEVTDAQFRKDLNKQLADGNISQAQATLKQMQTSRDTALSSSKQDAQTQLNIERSRGAAILNAQRNILQKQRDQEIQAAQDTAAQSRAQAVKTYGAGKVPQARLDGIDEIERKAIATARSNYASDAAAALDVQNKRVIDAKARLRAEQERAQKDQDKADADHDKKKEEQEKARQQVVQQARDLDVKGAQLSFSRLKQLRDAELRDAGDNVVQKLAIQERYRLDLQHSQEAIALAQLKIDKAAANSGPIQNKAKATSNAYATYYQALFDAKDTSEVTKATGDQTDAVRKQRDAYSKLADQMREAIKAGGMDAEAKHEWMVAFNDLGRETEKLGLTNDHYVEGARKATFALTTQSDSIRASLGSINEAVTQTDTLLDGLDARLQDMRETEQIVSDLRQAAFGQGIPDSAPPIDNRDTDPTQRPDSAASNYLKALGLAPDAFAALASTTIPDAMQEATTPEQYAGLGAVVLRGLVDGLADKAGWEKVRDAMQLGLNQALETDSLVMQAPVVPGINTGNLRGDDLAFGAQTDPVGQTDWEKNQTQINRQAILDSLKSMDREQLDGEKAFAVEAKDVELYNAVLAELKDRADKAAKAVQDLAEKMAKDQEEATAKAVKSTEDFMKAQQQVGDAEAKVGEAMGDKQPLYRSEIQALENLKLQYPQLAARIQLVIDAYMQLRKAGELDELAAGAEKLGQGLASIFDGFGMEGWGKITSSLGSIPKLLKSGMDAVGDFQDNWKKFSGDKTLGNLGGLLGSIGGAAGVVGAAISLIGGLGDAIMGLDPAYQLWKKNTLEQASAEQQAMGSKTYGNIANPYYDRLKQDSEALTTKANAGFWQRLGWSLFGGMPETLDKASSDALVKASNIFSDFAQSINGTLESVLIDATDNADFSGVGDALDKQMNKLIQTYALRAIIAKSNLSKFIQDFADDSAAGKDTTLDLANIRSEQGRITSSYQAIAPSLPGYGSSTSTTGSSTAGTSTFGAVPQSVQVAISTPLLDFVAIYDTATKRFDNSTLRDEATSLRNEAIAARLEVALGMTAQPAFSSQALRR